MKAKWILLAIVAAAAVLASVMLNAAPRGQQAARVQPVQVAPSTPPASDEAWGVGFWGCGPWLGRLAAELGLTDQQLAQLRQIQQDFLTATLADRTELLAKIKQMIQLWSADEPNVGAIRQLAADIDEIRARIRDAAIDRAASALSILTPEQRDKLKSIIKSRWPMCWWCAGCGLGLGPGGGLGLGPGPGAGPRGGRGMGPGWGNGTGPRGGTPFCPLTR